MDHLPPRPTYPGTDRVITRGDRFLAQETPSTTRERVVNGVHWLGERWVVNAAYVLTSYLPQYGHVVKYLGPSEPPAPVVEDSQPEPPREVRLAFDYELHGPIFREAGVQPGSEIHEHDENLSLVDILGIVYSFYGGDDSDDWAQAENIRRVLPVLSAPGRVENDHGNGWRAVIVSREVPNV